MSNDIKAAFKYARKIKTPEPKSPKLLTDKNCLPHNERVAVLQALAKSVTTRREVMGLTQKELASILGMPQSSMSALERGKGSIQVPRLAQLAAVLGVDVASVIEPAHCESIKSKLASFHATKSSTLDDDILAIEKQLAQLKSRRTMADRIVSRK